jgi:hypothetical protein
MFILNGWPLHLSILTIGSSVIIGQRVVVIMAILDVAAFEQGAGEVTTTVYTPESLSAL